MHIVPAFKAAAIQFEPVLSGRSGNLPRLLGLLEEAGRRGARLAVLPELAASGYFFSSREEIAPFVETIPGPTTDAITKLAERFSMYVVVSLPELDPATGVFYNAAALVGPAGLAGKYRKVHSFYGETAWAKDGDLGFRVFETPLGRIAILVCMDADFFESARVAALKGAEVVCLPTAWVSQTPARSWRCRALENSVYFLAADRWGEERGVAFAGGSCVISPRGEVLASVERGDGIVMAEVNIGHSRDKEIDEVGDILGIRVPEEYHAVLSNSYLWQRTMASRLPGGRGSTIRVFHFDPTVGAQGGNMASMATMIEESWAEGRADIAVFPELSITGFLDGEAMREAAEPVPGPSLERLAVLASEFDTNLVVGLAEVDGDGRLYNSAVLLEPGGVAGVYRKIHLNEYDRTWASRGDLGIPVFDIPAGRIGLAVGSEMLVPEVARCIGKKGADLIACPSFWPWRDWEFILSDRASNNDCYLAVANQSRGRGGRSLIYGNPANGQSAYAGQPHSWASLNMDTSPGSFCREKDMLRKVQPAWYDAIVRKRA